MKNNKGFSLVELIVVIAIMAILAAVAIPTFASCISKANVATDVDFLNNAEYAAELAYTADPSKTVDYVTVTLKADGTIEKVTVYFKAAAGEDAETAVVAEANKANDNEEGMIANTIDWTYKFKSEKNCVVRIDTANAKALAKVTTNTNTNNGEG